MMVLSVLAAGLFYPVFAAAESLPVGTDDLMSVLRITLANQPEIKLSKLDIEIAKGRLQEAGGDFDSTVYGKTYYEKVDSYLTDFEKDLLGYDADKSETTGLEIGVRKVFRSGLTGEASFISDRVDDQSGIEGYPTITRNKLEFVVTLPLLRGGGVAITVEERQSQLAMKAADLRYYQKLSNAVETTVAAYWEYVEAYKYLEIKKDIEQRATTFLKNTNRLIELDERPAADAKQVRAQLASKRSERIEAERYFHEAKQKMGMAMGISSSQLNVLAIPSEDFPTIRASDCTLMPTVHKLFDQALEARGDYHAARLDKEIIGVELEKIEDETRPQLDLKLSINYEGVGEDNPLSDPATEETAGPGGLIQLEGEWPVRNNKAMGKLMSMKARQRQAELRTYDLERNIQANIATAVTDVCRTVNAVASTNEAVDLYNTVVDNEVSKLTRGLSTLIDVISVEDKRNDAREDLVILQSSLAKAIVHLRNETGSLMLMEGGKGILEMERMISLPLIDGMDEESR